MVIVGGGIAGASLACFLAEGGMHDVLLVEREAQPGYHATGRSAAVLVRLDPVPVLQQLKVLSAGFLRDPPADFADGPLLERSGVLLLMRQPLFEAARAVTTDLAQAGVRSRLLAPPEVAAFLPVLAADRFDGAVLLPDDGRIDVHALLTAYLRRARRAGLTQHLSTGAVGVTVEGGRCVGARTSAGEFRARWVVNAAGAWAARVGELAGALPVPLVPHRRTIVVIPAPDGVDVRAWPFVASVDEGVYFAPESGGLLVSPMDEVPMEPHDAHPDELAVAEALEHLRALAPTLAPRRIRRAWAGLRTFTPDRVPVVGEDPRLPGFFWLAGQGGSGIETSPLLGRIAADLLLSGRTARFDASLLWPRRFAGA